MTARQRLAVTYIISWERDDEQVRLSMGRQAPTWPSDAELAIIRNAFAVPDDVEASRRTVEHTSPKTGQITRWCTVTLTWRERQPIINR